MRRVEGLWPGLFPASHPGATYAVPIWGGYGHSRELLGLALFDMVYYRNRRLDEKLPATRYLLGFAGEILASRLMRRRFPRVFRVLPIVQHGTGLQQDFGLLDSELGHLLTSLKWEGPSDGPDDFEREGEGRTVDRAAQVTILKTLLTRLRPIVERYGEAEYKTLKREQDERTDPGRPAGRPRRHRLDLGPHPADKVRVELRLESDPLPSLPIHPADLGLILEPLLDNVAADRRAAVAVGPLPIGR